ncbi:RloB family protein [Ciceribacter sp. T2.26MG-112.2]|uniref:RloB family protein n=1 Tax=Ciceribacter sp. T2.26MG-112.2 TaxID=3137154 RepID=UPI0012B6A20F|nr:RloB family protein [Ciceribacter naphthalenivorans]
MRGSRRFSSLRRKVENRTPKQKIVIYSEGEKTERDYFDAMRRSFQSVLVDIEIIGGAGVPLTIAKAATLKAQSVRRRNRGQSYASRDEFWAVFDRDEHPNVQEAIDRCHQADVGVAFSDPCFELWLILHFQDYDRPDHRHDVQRYLERLCGDYDHARRKTTNCEKLMALVVQAETRAERQLARRKEEGDPPASPYTTVYELTRRIRTR